MLQREAHGQGMVQFSKFLTSTERKRLSTSKKVGKLTKTWHCSFTSSLVGAWFTLRWLPIMSRSEIWVSKVRMTQNATQEAVLISHLTDIKRQMYADVRDQLR